MFRCYGLDYTYLIEPIEYTNTSSHVEIVYWRSSGCNGFVDEIQDGVRDICHVDTVDPGQSVWYGFPGDGSGYIWISNISGEFMSTGDIPAGVAVTSPFR